MTQPKLQTEIIEETVQHFPTTGQGQENDQMFSLSTLTSRGDLEAVAEINLDQVTHEEAFGADDDNQEDEATPIRSKLPDKDEETGYSLVCFEVNTSYTLTSLFSADQNQRLKECTFSRKV